MAEVIALGASIIAIIQVADRVIGLCKLYIQTVQDAPSDLRAILIETSTMKTILENVEFLVRSYNNEPSAMLTGISVMDGPIEGCRSAMSKMEELFPSDYRQGTSSSRSKRQKVKASLTALAWPLKESRARKLVEEMTRHRTTITLALTVNSTGGHTDILHGQDTKEIKKKTTQIHEILSESQREKVYNWLQVTDPSSIHHRACKLYEPGTGDWMLRSPEWKDLLEGRTRCVWIHGIAGAGKTVFASHLIEKIKGHCESLKTTKRCAYVYYYCYYGHNQEEAAPFLKWTINSLCREADLVPPCLYKLYKHGGEPSLVELLHALGAILEVFDGAYFFIDAIDESMPRDDLLKILRDLATDSRFQKVQLLATSREYIDIEKVMEQISAPVSMRNPLVDEDIKHYVRAQLHKNPKFKHWSLELRDEVMEALSAKAKGMFRWAACQIDALQHLKGQSIIVKNALANLPKTLDETYERIFLSIPDEDRLFVLHALKWIYYNIELRGENISCSILLQAIERSTYEVDPCRRDYFYDEERLRELCGCLLIVIPEEREYSRHSSCNVSLAHYTVREYLDSVRILDSPAASFAVTEDTNVDFTRIAILTILNTQPSNTQDWETAPYDSLTNACALEEDFYTYCVVSSILSIKNRAVHLSRRDDITTLIFNIFDPSKPHFEDFVKTADQLEDGSNFFSNHKIELASQFWNLSWKTPPENANTAILISLLRLNVTCELSRKFMKLINIEEILKSWFSFEYKTWDTIDYENVISYDFEGSIIELFAQLVLDIGEAPFRFFLELNTGMLNPSRVLLSYLVAHGCESDEPCKGDCLLPRLLQLGAHAKYSEYIVTPLQIAVACWDLEGVRILLEAGADPNIYGNLEGVKWKKGSFCFRFSHLCCTIPLRICREGEYVGDLGLKYRRKGAPVMIEEILVKYGAKI